MQNFIVNNPTRLFFGKNVCEQIPEHLKDFGSRVLMVYGKGSIKNNGIYNEVKKQLVKSGKIIFEYPGIKSNPVVDDVEKAISYGIKNNVEFVVAVGGGSVIDSSKIISLCIPENLNPWDVMKYKVKPTKALPLIAVLTLAATGTEMNQFAVLQNTITNEKIGFGSPLIYPKFSFCDPSFTVSVNKDYTGYGIADIIAHSLEAYFGGDDSTLSDRFVVSIIRELAQVGPELLNNLTDYTLRAKAMWASTCALNGLTFYGRNSGDWGVHDIGHVISLLYDTPHGATLSIAYPAWMKHNSEKLHDRLLWVGKEVFNVNTVDDTILEFEKIFSKLNCPIKLSHIGITNKNEISDLLIKNKATGMVIKLNSNDLFKIVDLM